MTPKWVIRSSLLVMLVAFIGWSTCAVIQSREYLESKRQTAEWNAEVMQNELRWTDELYAQIKVGSGSPFMTHAVGYEFEVVESENLPRVLGELDGFEKGCVVQELWSGKLVPAHPLVMEQSKQHPISWVRWRFKNTGRWIAIAILGEDTRLCCKGFPIVAKRKNF